ncbi:hypothetical protein ACHAXH_005598 [Discostella pseudostelligera]
MTMATISADPRFILARSLLSGRCEEKDDAKVDDEDEGGGVEAAIDIFATLLEEARTTHGDQSLNAALCQFEYGNALFRAAVRRTPLDKNDDGKILGANTSDSKPAAKVESQREIIAAAAMKRSATDADNSTPSPTKRNDTSRKNQQWAEEQLPRVLRCIGDWYFFREEFADAVDMYLRSMQYREEAWDRSKQSHSRNGTGEDNESLTLEDLQCQRLLVEMYALISEALLLCPEDEDVVCHHSDEDENDGNPALKAKGMHGENVSAQRTKGTVLVKAKDRVEYAQSYYDMARVGLEEVLCRYGKMAASKVDVGNEKEDIGYLVMSVVGVGNSLSEQQQ